MLIGFFKCGFQAYNVVVGLGTGPETALLRASEDQRFQPRFLAYICKTYPFGTVKFVSRGREKVYRGFLQVPGKMADGLNRI